MKETNKNLLEELILGERAWKDPAVIRAISEDPEFAEAASNAAGTLGVLERNAARLDDVDMDSLRVTEQDRVAAQNALEPRPRSPLLRHSMWLIPSAAAAVLVLSQMQNDPTPEPVPHNATLGGTEDGAALPQVRNGFASFDFHDTLREGESIKIHVFASELEAKSLFQSGSTRDRVLQLRPSQTSKLSGYDEVWVVVECIHRAGHSRFLPGQAWLR
ncbi:MAG: hypothetical protein P1V35_10330 [Planctomycetota bacterium]|nr:hypothetical protein [Planctomycetota bacterium]